jgi:hypothetical protein
MIPTWMGESPMGRRVTGGLGNEKMTGYRLGWMSQKRPV